MRVFFLLVLLSFGYASLAQEKLEFGDTPTTNINPKYRSNHRDYKDRRIIHWVKTSPKGLLLGNRCMEEVTSKMGFVYLLQPNGLEGNKSGLNRFAHNFAAKLRITLRNGPFWRFKLKKKTKECRKETGDFVG
ncbi:MAG: hypothetical protein AAGF85_04250 [Bacteroidota bacterium]